MHVPTLVNVAGAAALAAVAHLPPSSEMADYTPMTVQRAPKTATNQAIHFRGLDGRAACRGHKHRACTTSPVRAKVNCSHCQATPEFRR